MLATGFLATKTASADQPPGPRRPPRSRCHFRCAVDTPLTLSVQVPGQDLGSARIVWEAAIKTRFRIPPTTISPKSNGPQW